MKIDEVFGKEGSEKFEIWLDHVEKTFQVMHRQGSLPEERWVKTATWFFRRGMKSWWAQKKLPLSAEDAKNWDIFKRIFQTRFIPLEFLDRKKDEFSDPRQGKMSATEYHRRFTDLSRYCPETAANPREMLRLFKRGNSQETAFYGNYYSLCYLSGILRGFASGYRFGEFS